MTDVCLEVARAALSLGLCAIPAAGHADPGNPKRPFGAWRIYQQQRPSASYLTDLYAQHQYTTVGVVCGKISAGLECLDFDTLAGYRQFQQAATESDLAPLIARIEAGYSERSPKGAHVLYFCETVGRSLKLNERLRIETRGEGGFVVIAPSCFDDAGERKQYQLKSGGLALIARISPAERDRLHSFIRALGATETPVDAGAGGAAAGAIAEGGRNNALTSLAGTLHSRGVSGQALRAALHAENKARCKPPLPAAEIDTIVSSVCRYPLSRTSVGSASIVWMPPLDLPTGMPVVPPLDAGLLLPRGLSDWVSDTAYRLQCPSDYPAVGLLVALSAVIGGRVCIRPKQLDNWTVTPNLWGLIIGRPSTLKSPAMAAALAPMNALESEAHAKYDADLRIYQAHKTAHDLAFGHAKKQATNKNSAVRQTSVIAANLASVMEEEPTHPKRTRYMVNDVTVEKLGEILAENPNGVLLFRDELKGFLAELEGEENATKRAFVLQAWTGDGGYNFDRIGRGHIRIERAILSVLGTTQPGVIEAHLASAIRGGVGDDGLIQRFQLAVYPEESASSGLVDKLPDIEASEHLFSVFRRLSALDPTSIGAQRDSIGATDGPWYLRFDAKAQALFNAWYFKLTETIRHTEHGAIASHYGKYRSLVPSLALILHLAEGHSGPVGEAALSRAIRWATFLKKHAARIYHYSIRSDARAACALGDAIKAGKVGDGFALRDVRRKGWAGLTSQLLCQQAIEILVEHNWLYVERVESNGKAVERCRVNPALIRT